MTLFKYKTGSPVRIWPCDLATLYSSHYVFV